MKLFLDAVSLRTIGIAYEI
jgi:hypothetical protein